MRVLVPARVRTTDLASGRLASRTWTSRCCSRSSWRPDSWTSSPCSTQVPSFARPRLRLSVGWLPRCLAAWLPGCLAALLPACPAAWLPGCLLPGCLAACYLAGLAGRPAGRPLADRRTEGMTGSQSTTLTPLLLAFARLVLAGHGGQAARVAAVRAAASWRSTEPGLHRTRTSSAHGYGGGGRGGGNGGGGGGGHPEVHRFA
jgi:hypothetical protein